MRTEQLPEAQAFRLPNRTQRVAVVGRTGSGKTQFGFWLLSMAPFDRQPYIVIDYKGEELFNSTDRIREIGPKEALPKYPGLYKITPMVNDDEPMEAWLWKAWAHENIGIYVDEGYRLPKPGDAFNAILTQGRSKHIPAIVLTQRPSWISRFVFSEADFYAVFHLNEKSDKKRVQEFIPREKVDIEQRLPDYWSTWYDVGKDAAFTMRAVPDAVTLSETIHNRLKPRRRLL